MIEILGDLTPLNRVICSTDYDRTIEYLAREAPFRVLCHGPGIEHNGCVIPSKWDAAEAYIRKDGVLVYDGLAHALGVIVALPGTPLPRALAQRLAERAALLRMALGPRRRRCEGLERGRGG